MKVVIVSKLPTPGNWHYEPCSCGSHGGQYQPSEPGHPPLVYAEKEVNNIVCDIIIAAVQEPTYEVPPDEDQEWDTGIRHSGDPNANAQLIVAAVNAVKSLNPDDPLAAVKEMVEIFDAASTAKGLAL